MDFYNAEDILPPDFSMMKQFQKCLVSMQSSEKFYSQMGIKRRRKHGRSQVLVQSSEHKPSISRGINPPPSCILFLRTIDLSQHYVPECSDFVVYLIKKDNNQRVLRLYQCKCDESNLPFDNNES